MNAHNPLFEPAPHGVQTCVAAHDPQLPGLGFVANLKLLYAALGAGGSVVPLGDNGRTARLLAEYAAALRDH